MNRLEPNLLLAVSTAVSMALLIVTATVFGEPGPAWRYVLMSVTCAVLFVVLQIPMARMLKQPARPPMIHPDAPSTAVWAAIFPAIVMICAIIPVIFPGHDYAIMIIFASVFLGQTINSALTAFRKA